jgi:hypothetical protein
MNDDLKEGDALWKLLGRTPACSPSPFFARNTLRSVRACGARGESPTLLFRLIKTAAFALLLLGFSSSILNSPRAKSIPPELVEYFDMASGLDQLTFVYDLTPEIFAGKSL